MIWFRPISARGEEITSWCLKIPFGGGFGIHKDFIYLLHPRIFAPAQMMADHLPHKWCAHFEQVPSGDWGKVIFYGLPHQMKQVARFIDSLENRQVNFIASSISTYEMLAEGVHKARRSGY